MKTIFKILKNIILLVLCFVLIINIYTICLRLIKKDVLPMVFGYSNAVVITGSMVPNINAGDMIIIKEKADYNVRRYCGF